ncbi:hypothetical protein CRYUN_Cryun05aG0214900 [Craigia yunnanensis]
MSAECSVTKRLDGKVALMTGGASGLGESTAKVFVKHGAKVLIADVQDELRLSLCQEIGTESIGYVHCDVTCESDYGKLDIMFNNAGIMGANEGRVTDTDTEDFKKVDSGVPNMPLGSWFQPRKGAFSSLQVLLQK